VEAILTLLDFVEEGEGRQNEILSRCKFDLEEAWREMRAEGLSYDVGNDGLRLQIETLGSFRRAAHGEEEAYKQMALLLHKYKNSVQAAMVWSCVRHLIETTGSSPKLEALSRRALVQGYLDDQHIPRGMRPYEAHIRQAEILRKDLACTVYLRDVRFVFLPGETPAGIRSFAETRDSGTCTTVVQLRGSGVRLGLEDPMGSLKNVMDEHTNLQSMWNLYGESVEASGHFVTPLGRTRTLRIISMVKYGSITCMIDITSPAEGSLLCSYGFQSRLGKRDTFTDMPPCDLAMRWRCRQ
jgi:hypothetical protein